MPAVENVPGEGAPPQQSGVKKKVNKLFSVCLYILIVETMERFCFYTLYFNYPVFLINAGEDRHGVPQSTANALKQSFKMLAYLAPIIGGYLADNVYGRYKTILYFTICYVVGMVMIAIAGINGLMESESHIGLVLFIVGSFVFVSFGTGAIKPNVVNFGAEQYDENDPEEAEQQKSYFSYFYLVINVGAIFSSIWMTGLATGGVTADSAGSGFFYAFLAAAIAMAVALVVFLIGTPKYSDASKAVPKKSQMMQVLKKHLTEGAARSVKGKMSLIGWCLVPVYLCVSLAGGLVPGDSLPSILSSGQAPGVSVLQLTAFILLIISSSFLIIAHANNDWIQPLAVPQGDSEITTEEVRGFMRALPTIICVTVGFNVCYGGLDIYPIQACQMDVRTGLPDWINAIFFLSDTKQFNSTFYGLGNNAAIIVMIPLFEKLVFPAMKKCRGGVPVSRMMKFNAGFFFCILACVTGVVIEAVRKNADFIECPAGAASSDCFCALFKPWTPLDTTNQTCAAQGGTLYLNSNCAPAGVPMSKMNGWWSFIPFWFTGCGEILVNPVVQEFSFSEVSPRLKSILMGVTCVVLGTLPAVISGAFTGFIPNNLNEGNVDYVFYAYIGCGAALLFAYWGIALPENLQRGQSLLRDEARGASFVRGLET